MKRKKEVRVFFALFRSIPKSIQFLTTSRRGKLKSQASEQEMLVSVSVNIKCWTLSRRGLVRRRGFISEKERLHSEKERLHSEKERLHREKERLHSMKERLHREKERLHSEKQRLHSEKERLHNEKERLHNDNERLYR